MRFKPVVYLSARWVTMDYSNTTCLNVTETIVLYPAHQLKLSTLQGNIIAIYLTVVGKFLTSCYTPKKLIIYGRVMRYSIFLISSSNSRFLNNRYLISITRLRFPLVLIWFVLGFFLFFFLNCLFLRGKFMAVFGCFAF